MQLRDKLIVVTGAGSGIGRELAIQLCEQGAIVAGVDYNVDALTSTGTSIAASQGSMFEYVLDVSDRDAVRAFSDQLVVDHQRVDAVINNAGIIHPHCTVEKLPFEQLKRVFDINWWGTYFMLEALLPHLHKQASANIVNLSSMGGYMPFPNQVGYGASKAAVKLLTEGLRVELANSSNITVSVVYPGAVQTGIGENSPGLAEQTQRAREQAGAKEVGVTSAKAAADIIRGMKKGQARILVGVDSWVIDKLYRVFPTATARFMAWMINRAGPDFSAAAE